MADKSRTSAEAQGRALAGKELKVYHSDDRLPIWHVGDAGDWLSTRLQR